MRFCMSTLPYQLSSFGLIFNRNSNGELLEVEMDEFIPFVHSFPLHLELVEFLTPEDGGFVHRDIMLERAHTIDSFSNTCQYHAEYMLRVQDKIPVDWQDYYLLFPGTRRRGRDGRIYVVYLGYDRDRKEWKLEFHWAEHVGWCGKARLVRLMSGY